MRLNRTRPAAPKPRATGAESPARPGFKSRPGRHHFGFKSLPPAFKPSKLSTDGLRQEIYDYEERLKRYRRIIGHLRNGRLALRFLEHLSSLGLSLARLSKYASHIPALLRLIDFDLAQATRDDIERVVAEINQGPWKEWTKHDKKVVLRKLIQYAKYGRCDHETPIPPEVSWIKLVVKENDTRVTPENLLTPKEFKAIVKVAENARDRALIYVLFEAALRPGELLGMNVGSAQFRESYCLITVTGKTGLKRIPLVVSYNPLLDWLKEHPARDNPMHRYGVPQPPTTRAKGLATGTSGLLLDG